MPRRASDCSSLRERIVAGADFAELARVNSEDGTAAKGGDLGWISPGRHRAGVRARHERPQATAK